MDKKPLRCGFEWWGRDNRVHVCREPMGHGNRHVDGTGRVKDNRRCVRCNKLGVVDLPGYKVCGDCMMQGVVH